MSRILERFYRDEFSFFKETLVKNWSIENSIIAKIEGELKAIHKKYLSLACAASIIGYRQKRNEYVLGIVEASHLSIILAVKGLDNPTFVLLRQTIELALKHVYFSTHPVEYGWASKRLDYKELTFQNLIEYLIRTEEFRNFDGNQTIYQKLNDKHSVLSRYVHVHNKDFIKYRKVGRLKSQSRTVVPSLLKESKELWPVLVIILLIHFPLKFHKASALEQDIIKKPIPRSLLRDLNKFLSY